ncbi:MAG: molybdate ABC transporter substrate-binding protein [Clostridiales bacterium]|nr:molybdate ABC transporter substrate-binding protein [Clostridiales bacterium]
MKKAVSLVLALVLALSLTACGTKKQTEKQEETQSAVELTVFAAASMQETLTKIIDMYKTVAPNVTVTPTFDSSGTLLKQIAAGADCDLFISAAQKQMNALDGSLKGDTDKNPDGLDLLAQGTRVNLLENKVALVAPEGNPAGIESFSDLASDKVKLLAMGNSDVPVGSYTLEILKYLNLDIAALEAAGKVTYGSNVKEVTTQVSQGAVDCGVIYATDAFSANLTVVDTATTDMCKQVIYPAAILNTTQNQAAAQAFLDYLQTPDCTAVFKAVGFSAAK